MLESCHEKYASSSSFLIELESILMRGGDEGIEGFIQVWTRCGDAMLGELLTNERRVNVNQSYAEYQDKKKENGITRPGRPTLSDFRRDLLEFLFKVLAELRQEVQGVSQKDTERKTGTPSSNQKNTLRNVDLKAEGDVQVGDTYIIIKNIVINGDVHTFEEVIKQVQQEGLKEVPKGMIDDALWEEVQRCHKEKDTTGLKEALAKYLDPQLNPNREHKAEGEAMLKDVDVTLWETAKGGHSRWSYEQYLISGDLKPHQKNYATEASNLYDEIWWDEIKEDEVDTLLSYLEARPSFLLVPAQYKEAAVEQIERRRWEMILASLGKGAAELKKAIDDYLDTNLNPEPKRQKDIEPYKNFAEVMKLGGKEKRFEHLQRLQEEKLPDDLRQNIEIELLRLGKIIRDRERHRFLGEMLLILVPPIALSWHYWRRGMWTYAEVIVIVLLWLASLAYSYQTNKNRQML